MSDNFDFGNGGSTESIFDISAIINKYFLSNNTNDDIESILFYKACKYPYCLKTMSDGYFKNKRFKKAFNIYSYLVNIKTDIIDQIDVYNKIAYMYKNGLGIERSYSMAVDLYEKASNCTELKNISNETISKEMKDKIRKSINDINDKRNTIEMIEKYCNRIGERADSDRRLLRLNERDCRYEEKIISHIKKTTNINAAHILKDYFYNIGDTKNEQMIIELLAQFGNINACYATFIHYASLCHIDKNNAILAKKYLKLYFQKMLNKVNNIELDELSYTSFLPSYIGHE
jgi:hypothetical protein